MEKGLCRQNYLQISRGARAGLGGPEACDGVGKRDTDAKEVAHEDGDRDPGGVTGPGAAWSRLELGCSARGGRGTPWSPRGAHSPTSTSMSTYSLQTVREKVPDCADGLAAPGGGDRARCSCVRRSHRLSAPPPGRSPGCPAENPLPGPHRRRPSREPRPVGPTDFPQILPSAARLTFPSLPLTFRLSEQVHQNLCKEICNFLLL